MPSKAVTDAASPCAAIVTALHEEGVQRRWQLVAMLKQVWGYDEVEAGSTIDAAEKNKLITCVREGAEASEEAWQYMLPGSGIGVPLPDQSVKRDAGKPKMSHLLEIPHGLESVVEVFEHGAERYGARTWDRVEPQRYKDAAMRHIMAMGPDLDAVDPESGLRHRQHALWNLLILEELERRQ